MVLDYIYVGPYYRLLMVPLRGYKRHMIERHSRARKTWVLPPPYQSLTLTIFSPFLLQYSNTYIKCSSFACVCRKTDCTTVHTTSLGRNTSTFVCHRGHVKRLASQQRTDRVRLRVSPVRKPKIQSVALCTAGTSSPLPPSETLLGSLQTVHCTAIWV